MDDHVENLDSVRKEQRSIVEAIKELDAAKEAFKRSSRIEKKISSHETEIENIKKRMEFLTTYSYVNSKRMEFINSVEQIVRGRLDEFYFQLGFDLNKKMSESEAKKIFETKVPWTEFIGLRNTVNALKLKVDSYIDVEAIEQRLKVNHLFDKIKEGGNEDLETLLKVQEHDTKMQELEKRVLKVEKKKPVALKEVIKTTTEIHKSQESPKDLVLPQKVKNIKKTVKNLSKDNTATQVKIKDFEETLKHLTNEIKRLDEDIGSSKKLMKEIEDRFVSCLRANSIQKQYRKDKIVIEKISDNNFNILSKELKEKNKRIATLENSMKFMNTEVEFMKYNLGPKIKDIQGFLGSIDKIQKTQENCGTKSGFNTEENEVAGPSPVRSEHSLRRYNVTLSNSPHKAVGKSFEHFKGLGEDFSRTQTALSSGRAVTRKSERGDHKSPKKLKLFS